MDHDTSSPLYGLLFHHVSLMTISWGGENWMQLFWRGKFTGNPHRSIKNKNVFPVFRFSCSHSMDLHHFPFWAFLHGVALCGNEARRYPSVAKHGNSKIPLSMETIYGTINYDFGIFSSKPCLTNMGLSSKRWTRE